MQDKISGRLYLIYHHALYRYLIGFLYLRYHTKLRRDFGTKPVSLIPVLILLIRGTAMLFDGANLRFAQPED